MDVCSCTSMCGYATPVQRFLVPVYYWKPVEIMISDVNYSGTGSIFYEF